MRYVAAYLLATLGGNKSPSEDDIKKILSSVGVEAESEPLKKVVSELSGKDLDNLIKQGTEKLATIPAGGGGGSAPAAGAAATSDAGKAEEKKEEKKEEEEEEDEDMGFSLFD